MKVIDTFIGRAYAVECVGEVTVTNTRTGAVVATGDGSGQVYFVAADLQYTVSDAAALVTELFKLAPRLKLSLLQGGAGGLLPAGFTELEYLETSGTQYIKVPHKFNDLTGLQMKETPLTNSGSTYNWPFAEFVTVDKVYRGIRMECWSSGVFYSLLSSNGTKVFRFDNPATEPPYEFSYNYKNSRKVTANGVTDPRDIYVLDSFVEGKTVVFGITWDWINERQDTFSFAGRYYYIRLSQGEDADMALTPVLRNADGVAGMWDSVGKHFYTNEGSGTFGYRIKRTGETVAPMSRRDPYYVPPSGVYARSAGENALEILADTEETTGDDWEWFANTAEAYEYFGILPQEEELLTE